MFNTGFAQPSGNLALRPVKSGRAPSVRDIIKRGLPNKQVNPFVNEWRAANMIKMLRGAYKVWIAEQLRTPFSYGALYLTIIKPATNITDLIKEYEDIFRTLHGENFVDWAAAQGAVFKYMPMGLAGTRVVTDDGVEYIVDAFQNSVELEDMKYHGLGTGSTAEAVTDAALVTELTTEYTGNVRATGTTTEGATANVYRTVATNTMDETPGAALREHGIFSAASAGVLLDRTVFAAITLSSGDGLQSTYDMTHTSGS